MQRSVFVSVLNWCSRLPSHVLALGCTLITMLLAAPQASAQQCPDLGRFLPEEDQDWPVLVSELLPLMGACLQSSEYFALLGAAQLNSGLRGEAFEALERALLLNPDNGSAQIDYAQALFLEGQLFSALDLNQQLLDRQDLPPDLRPALQRRQEQWRGLTRETQFSGQLLAGFDDNLNGAPDPGQVTLTLSGESVLLGLNPEFRPVSGPYLNLGVAAQHRRLEPGHQHGFTGQLRSRASEDENTDLLQMDGRYSFIRPRPGRSWQLDAGVSNLFFGGSALFTASQLGARFTGDGTGRCRPHYDFQLQHQLFHNQSRLNAVDSRLGGGLTCPFNGASSLPGLGQQQLSLQASILNSQAMKSARPGGDRQGWQLVADWQAQLGQGTFRALLNHTRLDDRETYSELLINGGERRLRRSFALLQYSQPFVLGSKEADFVANFYHQKQASNIELFETTDTTFELGIRFRF